MIARILVVAAVVLACVAGPTAQADPPPNDEVAHAALIESLPYSDGRNIYDASLSTDEPRACLPPHGSEPVQDDPGTIWYRYTASSDEPLAAVATGYYNGLTIAVYASGFEQVACASFDLLDDKAAVFTPASGETYLVRIAKLKRDDPLAHGVSFTLRPAIHVDLAITGMRITDDQDPTWRYVEVDVANRSVGTRVRGVVRVYACSQIDPSSCSEVDQPYTHVSVTFCDPCTHKILWQQLRTVCAGDVIIKAVLFGLGIVDTDSSNNISSTTSSVLAAPGIGICAL